MRPEAVPTRLVIVGCGALARELLALTAGIPGVRVEGVDARLHMRPERIADGVAAKVEVVRERFGPDVRIFVAYADCGTAGTLDAYLEREGIERIDGAHCFEFYAGRGGLRRDAGRGGRHVLPDRLPGPPVRLDHHRRPRARSASRAAAVYFGNYRRLVYLAQTDDPELSDRRASAAADRLGLAFERRSTGYGELAPSIHQAVAGAA